MTPLITASVTHSSDVGSRGPGSGSGSVEESGSSASSSGNSNVVAVGRNHMAHGLYNANTGGVQLTDIEYPGPHDVMLGRGSGTSNHIGNITFRMLANDHKPRYVAASRVDKPKVAGEVVQLWRQMKPMGRFLVRMDESQGDVSLWRDVGDRKARQKTSQCLREKERPRKEREKKRKRPTTA